MKTQASVQNSWRLPTALTAYANELLDLQMWCWGRDVRYEGGNLLIGYGFRRDAKPEDGRGCTAYHHDGLTLWGWGIFYTQGKNSAIFIKRQRFDPIYVPTHQPPGIWHVDDLPHWQPLADDGSVASLVQAVIARIVDYETWVKQHTPDGYRSSVMQAIRRSKTRDVSDMAQAWRALADKLFST